MLTNKYTTVEIKRTDEILIIIDLLSENAGFIIQRRTCDIPGSVQNRFYFIQEILVQLGTLKKLECSWTSAKLELSEDISLFDKSITPEQLSDENVFLYVNDNTNENCRFSRRVQNFG